MAGKVKRVTGVSSGPNLSLLREFNLSRPLLLRAGVNLFLGLVLLLAFFYASVYNYLLFHSFAELIAIVIACGIFMFTWNTRAYLDNEYLRFVGISFLFIAFLDATHMMAYKGINIFANQGTNLASQLWIAGRYMQAFTFLLAALFFERNFKAPYVVAGYSIATLLLLGSIFYWQVFPTTFIEGTGLTDFKILSEYLISSILFISAALLLLNTQHFKPKVLSLLLLSIFVTILSELTFTLYTDDYGFFNALGHFFRIISYYLLYNAILVTGLVEPFQILFRKLKENQEELWRNMLELQSRNDELDAFAHTVAHDLKNPIAAISISISTLSDTRISETARQTFLEDTNQTIEKMNNIIDGLLFLSTVRKSSVPMEEIDTAHILDNVRERLKNLIEDREAELISPAEWPTAIGYEQWVEEVWINYITNAIQYGGIPPVVEIGAEEQGNNKVRFWVKDNGQGISPEDQEKLFVEFTELRHLHRMGHGLGLSIVRRITERLGGEVGVESQPGQGSTFYFTLPKSCS